MQTKRQFCANNIRRIYCIGVKGKKPPQCGGLLRLRVSQFFVHRLGMNYAFIKRVHIHMNAIGFKLLRFIVQYGV